MERIENLELRGITRRFGTATVLNNFNLSVAGGTFVTLLGPSGCGKSTALNCLAGLLDLNEGEILLNNKPIQHVPAEKRSFGMVFQSYALFPHLTAARNVGYGLEIAKVSKASREQRVNRALKLVQLQDYGNRYPAQLSGGQQQRLAIARALVLEPKLLLLDEPLSNLDAKLRNEMRIEIKRLHKQLGLTTLYVTHDQSEAMSLSDIVVVMRNGQIEQIGTPQQIYSNPSSLYVADFMGYSNRLSVSIIRHEGAELVVQTDNGVILRATSTLAESSSWRPGEQVLACFRPDETTIAGEDEGISTANRLNGEVQLVEYTGKAFEVLARLNGNVGLQVLVHSHLAVEEGAAIKFGVAPNRLLLFPLAEDSFILGEIKEDTKVEAALASGNRS